MYISNYKDRYPTLKELDKARKQAKTSAIIEARSGRELMAGLIKLSKYPRVAGILNRRRVAVTAYKSHLVSDTEIDLTKHEQRLKQFYSYIQEYHTDLLFGSLLFKVVKGKNIIDEYANIQLEHIELTQYDKIDDNRFYLYDADGAKTEINANDSNEYIYLTDNDIELGGVMDSIADNIVRLTELMPKWDRLNNRMQGVISGTMDAESLYKSSSLLGFDVAKIQADLTTTLENIGSDANNVLQTLSGIDIKLASLVESSAANSYELYKQTIESDIAIALLGQANTTELPSSGGSYAALKVLNAVTQDLLFADINRITKAVNKFLVIEYKLSVGIDKICPYRFEIVIDDFEDSEANARALQYIVSSGIDIKIKKTELYEKIGYSMPNDGDETIDISANSVLASNTPVA